MKVISKCSICDKANLPLHGVEGGRICDPCLDAGRRGRDATTKAVRLLKDADELISHNRHLDRGIREMVSKTRSAIATQVTDVAASEADVQRLQLLDRLGTDCVALGVDAENSINPKDGLEKMLAHQLATAHKTALEITAKGLLESDSIERARTLNLAARFMDTFQRGLLTFQRLRTGGVQNITVHYATVGEGGQAIVGNVHAGGQQK